MPLLVDEMPAHDGDHLIDAVAELIAAVLDMHRRLPVRQVLAGDIGDAGHRSARDQVPTLSGRSLPKTPKDLSLRCKAERSMPTKAAVREILPPKRVTCASRYSRSKTSRASRSGSCMISPPFSQRRTEGASSLTSLGNTSARMAPPPAGARISKRSMTLR